MGIGAYGILVIFGLFILLLAVNPKLSCFGKRIRSPFYPLVRKKRLAKRADGTGKAPGDAGKKTEDYGFRLD
jgi:hypothetical protein